MIAIKLLLSALLAALVVLGWVVGSRLFESARTGALPPLTSIGGIVLCIAGAALCVWLIWKLWQQPGLFRR